MLDVDDLLGEWSIKIVRSQIERVGNDRNFTKKEKKMMERTPHYLQLTSRIMIRGESSRATRDTYLATKLQMIVDDNSTIPVSHGMIHTYSERLTENPSRIMRSVWTISVYFSVNSDRLWKCMDVNPSNALCKESLSCAKVLHSVLWSQTA